MKRFFSRRLLWLLLVAVAFVPTSEAYAQAMQEPAPSGSAPVAPNDPYESWNRKVFSFNRFVDRWALKPVAQFYRDVTPTVVDQGVTNFFNNLQEVRNFINSLLQLKPESAVVAAGRFTYNTVFGLGGIFDVATAFDLPEQPEDFGQTLGYWGAGSGPYLMLPFLGPSTPRHFTGLASDAFVFPSAWDSVESPEVYYARALQIVDKRADLIPAEAFMSGDNYIFVRNAFLQRRQYLINDGKVVEDPFASGNSEDLMLEDF
ncbi:VacJ family lipoprotein [Marinobacter koreensis]|uniref:VacJ family lipoprotein n=2 Tax=Marinobacter koreensis TaxID=335974 RepID=A0ABW0RGR6_9GAMM|nr:VacJ family lipoprotein [Marinobacter koreensis]MCK7548568.1 VacJ family lipoprotein [Marinobacter koreensis]